MTEHASPVQIWHQSYTHLESLPGYRTSINRHAAALASRGITVHVHGISRDASPSGPNDERADAEVCAAVVEAQRSGFDAVVLGCFYDPALQKAKSAVTIPVVGATYGTALVAESLGRQFTIVTLSAEDSALSVQLIQKYGFGRYLRSARALAPPISEAEIEHLPPSEAPRLLTAFQDSCRRARADGAEMIIPSEGVLAAFLAAQDIRTSGGMGVMDSFRVLWLQAELLARTALDLRTATDHPPRADFTPAVGRG